MKITVDKLIEEEACLLGILDFQKFDLQKMEWNTIKKINSRRHENGNFYQKNRFYPIASRNWDTSLSSR